MTEAYDNQSNTGAINSIFMIQRNRNSLSPSTLEMFIGDLYDRILDLPNYQVLELNPVLRRNALQEVLESDQIIKVSIRVDNLGEEVNVNDDLGAIATEFFSI